MRKAQKQAKELIQAANKVYHYRRDVISEGRLEELDKAVGEVDRLIKEKDREEDLKAATNRLDGLLRKIGGKIYPKTFWSDNVEVALVAAILVIGVRTFFFQPFIIPTNSMYPTYNGMTSQIYSLEEPVPNAMTKVGRFLAFGARHKELIPETSGPVSLLIVPSPSGDPTIKSATRQMGIFRRDQYLFQVGDEIYPLQVPAEFDMLSLLRETFDQENFETVFSASSPMKRALKLNAVAEAGKPLLRFDVLLGDALFVDRFTYHFKRPKAGDPFVFRTDPILDAVGKATNDYTPKYYIKRVGGVGEETLEIRESALYVNGEPRDEVKAFIHNNAQDGEYPGYQNHGYLAEGRSLAIPKGNFVALGDNSANSADSRFWGLVPEEAIVGRAIFIYYPFTKRWGLAE